MTKATTVAHTPGPWHADSTEESSEVLTADGVCIAQAIEPTDWQSYLPLLPRGEVQANRRLIAAAPDLLAAAKEAFENSAFHQADCKGVVEYVEGDIFDDTVGCDCYLSRIRAAIDKAEGRS